MDSIKFAANCTCPTLVLHAQSDPLVPPQHAQDLYDALPGGSKRLVLGKGDHNTLRGLDFVDATLLFLHEQARLEGEAPLLLPRITALTGVLLFHTSSLIPP